MISQLQIFFGILDSISNNNIITKLISSRLEVASITMLFKKKAFEAATLTSRQLDYGVTRRHPDNLDLVTNESISTAGADVIPIN